MSQSAGVESFGKYRLERLLATGGMGEVYLAQLRGPGGYQKQLVIKRLLRHLALRQDFVELFWNEARLAALLSHPNVVQLFELGEVDGEHFIAMEYVPGVTLGELARELRGAGQAVPFAVAAHACAQALRGLQYAHERTDDAGRPLGIIHRDVSADNVLVSVDGAVKLSDFGIAKATALSHTTHGVVKGKFAYMSPEQLRAERLDARSDLYGMGVVLYQLLAGRLPIEAASDSLLIQRVLADPPAPLPPEVPAPLAELALRALRKQPEQRPASARAMAEALEAWLGTQDGAPAEALSALVRGLLAKRAPAPEVLPSRTAVPSTHASTQAPSAPAPGRRRWLLAAAALGALGVTGGAAYLVGRAASERTAPSSEALPSAPVQEARVSAPAPAPVPAASPEPLKPVSAARPAAKPAKGTLVLRVYPWAEVFVDGKRLGVTPLQPVVLEAGRRAVLLKNPEVPAERRFTVKVPAGGTAVLEADLLKP